MHNFLDLVKRFHRDERGIFAVVFGILAIVLIATAGAVVDFTTVEQARARAQDALDSAALGLQPTIFTSGVTEDSIRPEAQAILAERLAGQGITSSITDVAINTTDGMLRLEATLEIPTAFVALVGVNSLRAHLVSEATRKRLNIEVAMVLDNSGSMAQQSRMTNLKAAANCAINILMNSDCASTATTATVDSVKIGIVPFTSHVNVGTAYRTAVWMDQEGLSDISNDNFDDDDDDSTAFDGPLSRFDLYDQLTNVEWAGCVESRKYPRDTNDDFDLADVDDLFVPQFAPDNPDSGGYGNNYLSDTPAACTAAGVTGTCKQTDVTTFCTSSGFCIGGTTSTYQLTALNGTVTTGAGVCSCPSAPYLSDDTSLTGSGFLGWTKTRVRTCNATTTLPPPTLSAREAQERMCKYVGNISTSGGKGPNQDCPTNPLTPLTNTKSTVQAAITAMYPQGYTNIHQGTIWGFHMLTASEPLTEARPATSATYKVMIIMTDGENTYEGSWSNNINNGTVYWAYGYPWNNPSSTGTYTWVNGQETSRRLASAVYPNPQSVNEMISALNARTVETCNNAKASDEGITIFTIGLNSPNQTTTDMLTSCASGAGNAYFPTDSSELIGVFQTIASQLADLRLAR